MLGPAAIEPDEGRDQSCDDKREFKGVAPSKLAGAGSHVSGRECGLAIRTFGGAPIDLFPAGWTRLHGTPSFPDCAFLFTLRRYCHPVHSPGDISERMLRAVIVQMLKSGALSEDDLIAAAEERSAAGDEEAGHTLACMLLHVNAQSQSEFEADRRRRDMRERTAIIERNNQRLTD